MSDHAARESSAVDAELLAAARSAAEQAYVPYSGFRVGAALRSAQGRVYAGCNVENAAYPVGGCAERAALAAAILMEGAQFRLHSLVLVATDADGNALAVTPCGACRQALVEFGADADVAFPNPDGRWTVITAGALLPQGFALPQR